MLQTTKRQAGAAAEGRLCSSVPRHTSTEPRPSLLRADHTTTTKRTTTQAQQAGSGLPAQAPA
jgi:hypothetical protein